MVTVVTAPDELRIPPNNLGKPAVAGAVGPAGVVVAAGQHGIRHAVAAFAPDLTGVRVSVLATDEAADWELVRLVPLPDGRFLMCALGRGPNQYVSVADPAVEVAPATDLVGVAVDEHFVDADPAPRDAFVVGDRLVLGHSGVFRNFAGYQYLSAVPATGGRPPEPWIHDLPARMEACQRSSSAYRWHAERSAVVGDCVLLAGQTHMRSGTYQHQLVQIGPGRAVVRIRPEDRKLVRDPGFVLVADRGRLLVAATGRLEVRDEQLDPVATATGGHPFTKAFRLLAGDGAGRLLWYSPRRHQLLLSTPDEFDQVALDASLDRLQAAVDGGPPAARPRRARAAGPRQVERHRIDTARFHHLTAGNRQELLDALAGRSPDPSRAFVDAHVMAEQVLGQASIFDPDDPLVLAAARALAQVTTAEMLWWRARRAGAESVEVPFGEGTATIRTSLNLGRPSPFTWREAWYAALCVRDETCQDLLAGVIDAELDTTGGPWQHMFDWKAALLAYRTDPANALPRVAQAVEHSDKAYFRTPFQWSMHRPHLAVYPLLGYLVRDDADGFNAALLEALRSHKKRYGTKSDSHRPEGWVALGPLAMCCLAHDRGMAVTVQSGYLLPYLIERRWLSPSVAG